MEEDGRRGEVMNNNEDSGRYCSKGEDDGGHYTVRSNKVMITRLFIFIFLSSKSHWIESSSSLHTDHTPGSAFLINLTNTK